jgi:hypothetical protein
MGLNRPYLMGHNPAVARQRPVASTQQRVRKWNKENPEKRLGYYLKRCYGITVEMYRTLETSQGHCCAICRGASPGGRYRYWCVDHDHVTGTVRGLLCLRCNAGIAALGDTAEGVKRAVRYFEPGCLDGISAGFLL